ncbi:hypothetical protein BR93DRAFT_939754 [Coniochaeta sp. PMI_546]|nr:hypothetical protein BR93DRAFT_939754 [Coniochaeta sp. PMI_546]
MKLSILLLVPSIVLISSTPLYQGTELSLHHEARSGPGSQSGDLDRALVPYDSSEVTDLTIEPRKEDILLTLLSLAIWAANTVPAGIQLAVGVLGLSHQAFQLAKYCSDAAHSWQNAGDCFFVAADILMGTFVSFYKTRNGKRSTVDGLPDHGIATFQNGTISGGLTHSIAHIPIINGSLRLGLLASGNNGSWAHVASFYSGDVKTHRLMYRLASEEDLGAKNNGKYHHLRTVGQGNSVTERAEQQEGALVADYLWEDNNDQTEWGYFSGGGNSLGSDIANWMENNEQEAACASPAVCLPTGAPGAGNSHPGCSVIDGGVMAYGWNDQPFGFNGRAQGWLDECHGTL